MYINHRQKTHTTNMYKKHIIWFHHPYKIETPCHQKYSLSLSHISLDTKLDITCWTSLPYDQLDTYINTGTKLG